MTLKTHHSTGLSSDGLTTDDTRRVAEAIAAGRAASTRKAYASAGGVVGRCVGIGPSGRRAAVEWFEANGPDGGRFWRS